MSGPIITPQSVLIAIGFLSEPTPGSTTASKTPCGIYWIALIRSKLPYLIFWAGMPWDISIIFKSESTRLITPFTTPTEPSLVPKSEAKEIIFFITHIIKRIGIKIILNDN